MTSSPFDELYPDLAKEGGIVNALQLTLHSFASPLDVTGGNMARIEKNGRFSQVYTALNERFFTYDFWDRGVVLAYAATPELFEVAKSIHVWIEDKANTDQLRKSFPFVRLEPIAHPFENDMEVEWTWSVLVQSIRERNEIVQLLPLLEAARERPELRQLFPYTSLDRLCFSRCTGYPYSADCPSARTQKDGLYSVYDAFGKLIGYDTAECAVQLLIDHLPKNAGPAKKGTADDL